MKTSLLAIYFYYYFACSIVVGDRKQSRSYETPQDLQLYFEQVMETSKSFTEKITSKLSELESNEPRLFRVASEAISDLITNARYAGVDETVLKPLFLEYVGDPYREYYASPVSLHGLFSYSVSECKSMVQRMIYTYEKITNATTNWNNAIPDDILAEFANVSNMVEYNYWEGKKARRFIIDFNKACKSNISEGLDDILKASKILKKPKSTRGNLAWFYHDYFNCSGACLTRDQNIIWHLIKTNDTRDIHDHVHDNDREKFERIFQALNPQNSINSILKITQDMVPICENAVRQFALLDKGEFSKNDTLKAIEDFNMTQIQRFADFQVEFVKQIQEFNIIADKFLISASKSLEVIGKRYPDGHTYLRPKKCRQCMEGNNIFECKDMKEKGVEVPCNLYCGRASVTIDKKMKMVLRGCIDARPMQQQWSTTVAVPTDQSYGGIEYLSEKIVQNPSKEENPIIVKYCLCKRNNCNEGIKDCIPPGPGSASKILHIISLHFLFVAMIMYISQ